MITAEQLEGYFIRINNRNNFLMKEIPNLHPESLEYIKYWKKQKKRCIEGFWSIDDANVDVHHNGLNSDYQLDELYADTNKYDGKWRFMTPNLYFYVNAGTITHVKKGSQKTTAKQLIRPDLRDFEWEYLYNWFECRGFSGFKDDDEYSCNNELHEFSIGERTTLDPDCINSKGEPKKYIKAREYLRMLHKKPLGLPIYNNQAKNLILMSTRDLGKSMCTAVGIILHEFLTDGAKEYTEETIKHPFKVTIFVGAAITDKSTDLLDKFKDAKEHLPGQWAVGTLEFKPSPLDKQTSGTLGPNNKKNAFRHEYDFKVGDNWIKKGSRSSIQHGIFTTDNPEAAAGTRPTMIVIEETGLLPNALAVHGSNAAALNRGAWKFGSALYIGTGGNVEKVQDSEKLFRDPDGFDMLAIDDIFENTGKMGFFVPAIYAPNEFKDDNGNTDVEAALEFFLKKRAKAKKANDPSAINMEMMNYPLMPSEMFLNATGAMFPQAMIKEHLATILANPHRYHNASYFGDLTVGTDGIVKWINGTDHQLVTDWPIKHNKDKLGCIQIWEMPQKDAGGNVFRNRYIQGTDTYDDDESSTTSLGSTFIMDLYTNRIVAEYTGRPKSTEFYEKCRMLNIFYSAEHNYENNKKGLFMWYDRKNSLHLLCDNPSYLKGQMDITIHKEGNKSKGTDGNKAVNAHGLSSQLDWMLEQADGQNEGVLNLHMIKSVGYLKECLSFNKDGNFDRISAMNMVCILRNQRIKFLHKAQEERVKDLSKDNFFERNYNRLFKYSR